MKKTTKAFLILVCTVACVFLAQALLVPFVREGDDWSEAPLPTNAYALGEYYFNFGNNPDGEYDLKKARAYFEQALREEPDAHEGVWYQLGRIDFLEGDFDAALYKFDKQREKFGDAYPNVYYMIGLTSGYKARGTDSEVDWIRAELAFLKYLDLDPASPWARTDLAWVYFAQGKFSAMRPVLELGLSQQPDHPWLLNMYGLYLLNSHRRDEAMEYFDRALAGAEALTAAEWGKAYPGNNPLFWDKGLKEFRDVVTFNRNLLPKE